MNIQVANPLRENKYLGIDQKNLYEEYLKGQYIGGSSVNEFENSLRNYFGVKHAVTLNSGTDALILGLVALGIKKNDEIIVPSFTYFATVEVILHLGAVPVFVDIDPITYCINVDEISKKITKKTKMILPVHIFGNNANIEDVSKIAKKYNLLVFEDCAQSFGSMTKSKKLLGTFGECAAFSFFPSKTLGGIGDGGCLITNNQKIYETVKALKNHGQKELYTHYFVGVNSRLDSLNAFVLNKKLNHFNKIYKSRNEIYEYFISNLSDISYLKLPTKENNNTLLNYFSIAMVESKREKLINYLNKKGIATGIYYKTPIHQQPVMKNYSFKGQNLKNTEAISNNIFSIPYYAFMEKSKQQYIVNSIKRFKL